MTLKLFFLQVMRKRRAAAVRQRTLVVNLRGKVKTMNRVEKMKKRMRTELKGRGRKAPAVVRVARRGPEKCEMRKRSLAVMMTAMTTSQRIQPGAVGRKAVIVRMKGRTEGPVEVAVLLQLTATAAVIIQRRMLKVEVEVREARTPVMPVTVNKACCLHSSVTTTVLTYVFSSERGPHTLSFSQII